MTTDVKPRLMTARNAATYAGVSIATIRSLADAGEIERVYIESGFQYRIVVESLDAWISSLPTDSRRSRS